MIILILVISILVCIVVGILCYRAGFTSGVVSALILDDFIEKLIETNDEDETCSQ